MSEWIEWVMLLVGLAASFSAPRLFPRSSRGRYEPSPHGCTHGYWVPCSDCSLRVRERYNRDPEVFPVYVYDQDNHVVGIAGFHRALAPMPERESPARGDRR